VHVGQVETEHEDLDAESRLESEVERIGFVAQPGQGHVARDGRIATRLESPVYPAVQARADRTADGRKPYYGHHGHLDVAQLHALRVVLHVEALFGVVAAEDHAEGPARRIGDADLKSGTAFGVDVRSRDAGVGVDSTAGDPDLGHRGRRDQDHEGEQKRRSTKVHGAFSCGSSIRPVAG
jgi:hypothetical protein